MYPDDNDSSGYRGAVIGVDIGSTFSKAVLLSHGVILSWAIIPSVGSYQAVADEVVSQTLARVGMPVEAITSVIATGYGAAGVS